MPDRAADAPWQVYMLRCSDGSLYTGITTNLERRIAEHQSGKRGAKYLRGKEPMRCVFQYGVENRSEASRLENLIKRMPRHRKEQLLQDGEDLQELLYPRPAEAGSASTQ